MLLDLNIETHRLPCRRDCCDPVERPSSVPRSPIGGGSARVARAAAVSPLIEAGNIYLPHPLYAPWVNDFIEVLARFMVYGTLNENLFRSTIGGLIDRATASVSNGHSGKVRVFGEMVSQLRQTNLLATTRLEELWNEVIKEHSVSLLCTYALHNADDHIPKALVELHSHNIERELAAVQNA